MQRKNRKDSPPKEKAIANCRHLRLHVGDAWVNVDLDEDHYGEAETVATIAQRFSVTLDMLANLAKAWNALAAEQTEYTLFTREEHFVIAEVFVQSVQSRWPIETSETDAKEAR